MGKRQAVEVFYDAAVGSWLLIIRSGDKREAIALGRKVAKAIAPSELKPRNKNGAWSKNGRETYLADPRKSKG